MESENRPEAAQPATPAARSVVQLDSRQIRTLAHPLRARLLYALRSDGPATATALARRLDTNTGATSYHLRQLAEVELVAEEPDRGTGRQRYWRAVHEGSTWRPTDFDDDPDTSAASDWIQAHQVRQAAEYADRWLAARKDYPRQWREVADFSDMLLTLSPRRLRALTDELWQVVQRYREVPPTDATAPGPGRADDGDNKQVLLFLAAFPRVEENE